MIKGIIQYVRLIVIVIGGAFLLFGACEGGGLRYDGAWQQGVDPSKRFQPARETEVVAHAQTDSTSDVADSTSDVADSTSDVADSTSDNEQ